MRGAFGSHRHAATDVPVQRPSDGSLSVAFVRTREGAGRRQLLETSTRVLQL